MSTGVDLTNLREMTGGDKEMEEMLFQEFFRSSEECLSSMNDSINSNDLEAFGKMAHALKGMALNIGADHFAELCKTGQEIKDHDNVSEHDLIKEIQNEYNSVKVFLQKELS